MQGEKRDEPRDQEHDTHAPARRSSSTTSNMNQETWNNDNSLPNWASTVHGKILALTDSVRTKAKRKDEEREALTRTDGIVQESETAVDTTKIPRHPFAIVDFDTEDLKNIKEFMRNERNPPDSPITHFDHGDARAFTNPEDLETLKDQWRSHLSPYATVNPQNQQEADSLHDEMRERLIPGKDLDHNARINQWSSQLAYSTMNLGNLRRRPHIPNTVSTWRTSADKSMLLAMIKKCSAHVLCLGEAAGIEDPEIRADLAGWQFISSADTNLAIGVRSDGSARINMLLDTTSPDLKGGRDYDDDPTSLLTEEKILWYIIAEIDFGIVTALDHPDYMDSSAPVEKSSDMEDEMSDVEKHRSCGTENDSGKVRSSGTANKSSMEKIRVMTFCINNRAASDTVLNVRLRLRQLFLDAARYQVDYIGGDANGAIYKYFRNQPVSSIRNSSFDVMLRTYVAAVNTRIQNPEHKLHAQLVTSNSADTLSILGKLFNDKRPADPWSAMEDECLNIDCLVGVIFSWGHSRSLAKWRAEHAKALFDELPDKLLGYPEWFVKVAEYPMMLDNHHLWLNTRGGGDKDWHTPLLIRIRTLPTKNARKRTQGANDRRKAKHSERRANKRTGWNYPQTSWSSWNQGWEDARW